MTNLSVIVPSCWAELSVVVIPWSNCRVISGVKLKYIFQPSLSSVSHHQQAPPSNKYHPLQYIHPLKAIMSANYTTIQSYISTAPSCAVPCLNAFWNPYIASCGSSNWSCLCGTTINQQQQLTDGAECRIPFCSSTDMNSFGNVRGNLVAFCVNYPEGKWTVTPVERIVGSTLHFC